MKNKSILLKGKVLILLSQFFFILFCSITVSAQPTSQTFTSSGTYIIPAGYSANITIQAWGAGAGGGSNTSGARGGGGGGAFASLTTTLSSGSYTVTVGTGGGAGTGGGNSSFTGLVVAAGGSSTTNATGGAGGTVVASTGSTRIAGSSGAGVGGSNGGNGGNGANGGGNGGNGGPANNGSGVSGIMPGGGGGGKAGPGGGGLSGSGGDGTVIVTVNIVLPVKLSGFRAFEKPNGIQLEWTSAEESNLDKYEVLRSMDGNNFTKIGHVMARNIPLQTTYSFVDPTPAPSNNFYRIRIVDMDGGTGFSAIVKLSLDKTIKSIRVYPNPATGSQVAIQSSDLGKGDYTATIFTATGQSVSKSSFIHSGGAINQPVELPATMKPGLYFLQVDSGGENKIRQSFIIQ